MLLDHGVIDDDLVRSLLAWPHTGFGAHVGRSVFPRTPEEDRPKGVKGLLEYMVRAPVALSRMRLAQGDKVVYTANRIHPRHEADFRIFDPLDFIATVVTHIPDPHKKSVIYYGWYSNKQRGMRRKGVSTADRASTEAGRAPLSVRRAWAAMIKRVYAVDPLVCPACGGQMAFLALIEDEAVIFTILRCLGLLADGVEEAKAHDPPD